ncbi:DndB-like DNA-sulfur modification-associated protein [Geothermobacter ehrlichii]|uniref:DndB-like DNA-sulfur modification-associated protein n=1 Tax=Geothermobacter ehrlichii TaxID=213224 RepID=A0A5D3WIM1_9BACT|nr:DNA sulfur modification protein DndB [Geothermobacter ehrlichii]TYO98082.1 DndB-like DNA-sulfur modification-associated protein [Geothermobacter ehrlichii]
MKLGTSIEKKLFRLYGILGEFTVLPTSKWKICHFSTKASANDASDGGNSKSLLQELKPVRERISADKIKDMSSLLQRDLSDFRVANDLIPYLLSNPVGTGFFPGILVALSPKGFLTNGNGGNIKYPERTNEGENGLKLNYGDYWTVELFEDSKGNKIALGQISIDSDNTDLIVLDGQHRANAFRYLTNTFDDVTSQKSSVYKPFYSNCPKPPENFKSELPVTLVWFERCGEEEVSPLTISRRLFVDVNTNAKKVNEARNILLDDHDLSSICTSSFYSLLSSKSFSSKDLSLLQSGFDSDGETLSKVYLFDPVIIHYACSMFAIGKDEFNILTHKISRDSYKQQSNLNRLEKFFDTLEENEKPDLSEKFTTSNIQDALNKTINKIIYNLLSKFILFEKHINATEELRKHVYKSSAVLQEIWTTIYCGGEGLFSNYMSFEKVGANAPASAKTYIDGIKELETKFIELRKGLFQEEVHNLVDNAYNTLTTKASITGMLMALSYFSEKTGWGKIKTGNKETTSDNLFVNALNKLPAENWIFILTDLKKEAIGSELNPKLWIQMRNLFLRVVQSNTKNKYFDNIDTIRYSPDFMAVKRKVKSKIDGFKATNPMEEPGVDLVKTYINESINELKRTLQKCGLNPLSDDLIVKATEKAFISESVKKTTIEQNDNEDIDEENDD